MADAKDPLQFLERGVRLVADVRLKSGRIELAPVTPTGLGRQRVRFGGGQIAINRAPSQVKAAGRLNLGAAALKKLHHPFPQIQRIAFHARKPISLCPNVNMKCYN